MSLWVRYFAKRQGFYTKNGKIAICIIKSVMDSSKKSYLEKKWTQIPNFWPINLLQVFSLPWKMSASKNLIWGKYAWFAKKLAGSLPLIRSLALFYAYMITSFDYYSQPASLSCCCQSVFDFSLCTPKDIFTKKYLLESIQIDIF